MSTFPEYFGLGLRYISDIHSVEHILFLIALCAIYLMRDWKKVLVLIMYYSIGHLSSMILSTLNVIHVRMDIINYLVPFTIFLTSASNIFKKQHGESTWLQISYIPALFFGIIHGFGFADYFKNLIVINASVGYQLTSFIFGIETGQLLIAISFLIISWLFVNNFGVSRRDWILVISSGIAGIALTYMFESRFWVN
jgi:hypothetical protein